MQSKVIFCDFMFTYPSKISSKNDYASWQAAKEMETCAFNARFKTFLSFQYINLSFLNYHTYGIFAIFNTQKLDQRKY